MQLLRMLCIRRSHAAAGQNAPKNHPLIVVRFGVRDLGSDLIVDFKRNEESLTGKCQNLATILTWFLNGCKARSCPKQPVQNKLFEPLHGFSNRLKRR